MEEETSLPLPPAWYERYPPWLVGLGSAVVVGGLVVLLLFVVLRLIAPPLGLRSITPWPPVTQVAPGETLTLRLTSRGIQAVDLEYAPLLSTAAPLVFRTLRAAWNPESQPLVPWTVPSDLLGPCIIRGWVGSQETRSPVLTVEPSWTWTTALWTSTVVAQAPGVLVLDTTTNSSLVDPAHLRLETSLDGTTWTPEEEANIIQWTGLRGHCQVPASWAGTSQYLRVTTDHLLSQGYPRELRLATPTALTFVVAGTALPVSMVGVAFRSLSVVPWIPGGTTLAPPTSVVPGLAVKISYELSSGFVAPARAAWGWLYSTDQGTTWIDVTPTVGWVANRDFLWVVPGDACCTLRLKLQLDEASITTTSDLACVPRFQLGTVFRSPPSLTWRVSTPSHELDLLKWRLTTGGQQYSSSASIPSGAAGQWTAVFDEVDPWVATEAKLEVQVGSRWFPVV